MNSERRIRICALGPKVSALTAQLTELHGEVEDLRDEEQAYLDEMPESFKQGERGQVAESAVAALDDALAALDSVDTATIVASLGEAADRSILADTIEATVSPKERERRRFEFLPKWAKAELDRLAQQVETLNVKLAATLPEATGAPGEFLVGGYFGPLVGRRLPFERIDVPSFDVEIYYEERRKALTIRARRGGLVIRPLVSNEVLVRGEPFE